MVGILDDISVEDLTPSKIAEILAILEGRVISPRKTPERRILAQREYKNVRRHTTCQHCGRSILQKISLTKKESTFTIDENRKVAVVRYRDLEDGCTVFSFVSYCPLCPDFIASLSREDLEARYLALLKEGRQGSGTVTTVPLRRGDYE